MAECSIDRRRDKVAECNIDRRRDGGALSDQIKPRNCTHWRSADMHCVPVQQAVASKGHKSDMCQVTPAPLLW